MYVLNLLNDLTGRCFQDIISLFNFSNFIVLIVYMHVTRCITRSFFSNCLSFNTVNRSVKNNFLFDTTFYNQM